MQERQLNAANAVDAYVDYYKSQVKNPGKKKKLLDAQWAAENFKAYKDTKYLDQLKTIFNELNHHNKG